MRNGPRAVLMGDGRRLHLQHGPIDLIIEASGSPQEIARAYNQAKTAFQDVLQTLVDELALLRQPMGDEIARFRGPVARRMAVAVWPHRKRFITPMAAVAGSVADEILAAMIAGRELSRAYVNDGGDIALYLTGDECFKTGLVSRLDSPRLDGTCTIRTDMPVRGIATSGRDGRSFSLGIADAVTVLARNAAMADAAATLIANAVNVDDPAIRRVPASELDEDSDLGERPVTVEVGRLADEAVQKALAAGMARAQAMQAAGLIYGAMLALNGHFQVVHGFGLE